MTSAPDLDRYFERIGFDRTPRADLATLAGIARRHAAAIPFENLSPLLGEPVPLDLPALERKLLRQGRGGYCFEHNLLLAGMLRRIGFDVTMLLARVRWNRPPDVVTPRSHMLLKVDLPDGPHLVDTGFGGLTLTGAMRLADGVEQATPHEPFRLLHRQGTWRMEARVRDEWKALYDFDLQVQHALDFDAPNYYLSTHPQSPFVGNLICAKAPEGRRLALMNRQFTVHHLNGASETRVLETAGALLGVLQHDFGIDLGGIVGLPARFATLP